MIKANKQHSIGVILLTLTAVFWGAGFVLNSNLLKAGFANTPSLLNALRFGVSTLCLLVIFNKKIKFNKYILLYGGLGGAMLFAAFLAQVIGQKYTTPSHSGFFTASYAMFVPFITWIGYKKRPSWISFVGVAVAIAGLVILNFQGKDAAADKMWLGDVLTAFCAIMFALQIFWTDYTLKKDKIDVVQLTFWQIATAALLFVLYTVIFESKNYSSMSIDLGNSWWRLLIVIFGGTAFAYYAQTYSLNYLNPTETSLIMACESPIGAFLSVILLIEPLSWQMVVGGALVVIAVILVEVVPHLVDKKIHAKFDTPSTSEEAPPTDSESTTADSDNNQLDA